MAGYHPYGSGGGKFEKPAYGVGGGGAKPNPFAGGAKANPFGAKPAAAAAAPAAAAAGGKPNPFAKPVYGVKSGAAKASDATPASLLAALGDGSAEAIAAAGGEQNCFQRVFAWLPTKLGELDEAARKAAVEACILVLGSLTAQMARNDATQRRVSRAYFGIQQTKSLNPDLISAHTLSRADKAFQQLESRGFSQFGVGFDRLGPADATVEVAKAEDLNWDNPPASVRSKADFARRRSPQTADRKWLAKLFGGSDRDVATDKQRVALKCPYMMTRMRSAARASKCTPGCIGCVDLVAAIVIARQQGKPPPCPWCDAKLHEDDLIVDPIIDGILKKAPADCTAVEITADGQWKPVEFSTGDSDDDDGSD